MSSSFIFTQDVTIAAPPERVFGALTAIDQWPLWMPNLVRIEKLTDGPFAVGFRWRQVRRVFRREARGVFEVTAFEAPRLLALKVGEREGRFGRGLFTFRYDILPKAGLTQVALLAEISDLGRFSAWMFRLFGGAFKKAVARDLFALKAFLERPKNDK